MYTVISNFHFPHILIIGIIWSDVKAQLELIMFVVLKYNLALGCLKGWHTTRYCSRPSSLHTNDLGHPRYYRRQWDHSWLQFSGSHPLRHEAYFANIFSLAMSKIYLEIIYLLVIKFPLNYNCDTKSSEKWAQGPMPTSMLLLFWVLAVSSTGVTLQLIHCYSDDNMLFIFQVNTIKQLIVFSLSSTFSRPLHYIATKQTTQICLRRPWENRQSCAKEGPIVGLKEPQVQGMGCVSSRACTTMPGVVCGSMVSTVRSLAWELVAIRVLSLADCSSFWCWRAFAWIPHLCTMGTSLYWRPGAHHRHPGVVYLQALCMEGWHGNKRALCQHKDQIPGLWRWLWYFQEIWQVPMGLLP